MEAFGFSGHQALSISHFNLASFIFWIKSCKQYFLIF